MWAHGINIGNGTGYKDISFEAHAAIIQFKLTHKPNQTSHDINWHLSNSSGVPGSLWRIVANLANQDNQDTLQNVFFL